MTNEYGFEIPLVSDDESRLYEENEKLKDIIRQLIANAPNTYSGTNIELQQKKMFSFQNAVNKAKQFLKEVSE